MEGLYFESSATTPFHFMTVSELANQPSNPVRGLVYGSSTSPSDFALGVKHLQVLGVNYLMLFSSQSESMAAGQSGLKLIATVPDLDGKPPLGWKIYQVLYPPGQNSLVSGLSVDPVIATVHAGSYNQCWGQTWTGGGPLPELGPWECAADPWFMNAAELDKMWVASGPKSWKHIDIKQLPQTTETPIMPTQVSDIHEDASTISFHVSEIGKPVLVRDVVLPELAGARRVGSVPRRAEHDGGRADEPRREAHVRADEDRLARAHRNVVRDRGLVGLVDVEGLRPLRGRRRRRTFRHAGTAGGLRRPHPRRSHASE